MKTRFQVLPELRFVTPVCKMQVCINDHLTDLYLPEGSSNRIINSVNLSSPFIGNLNMSFPPFHEKNSNDMTAGLNSRFIGYL